jgi:hypothetical protein
VLLLVVCGLSSSQSSAIDLLLADGKAFPGQLWQSRDGQPERSIFRHQATANRAYPNAAMKIGQVAVGPDRKIYFASGLDGYVLHLLNGANEVVSFEFPGQVRDLDAGGEEHAVYFSVVGTPQNGEPLADGKIYRRDLWAGAPSEFVTVSQSQIGGNWWGTFAIRDGVIYIATLETPSRIFKLDSAGPEQVFSGNRHKIQGLTSGSDGSFYFVDGTAGVYRTADFDVVETVFRGGRPFTDVAVEPAAAATAP